MADLITRCKKTMTDVGNVALLMVITLFVFSLLAMQVNLRIVSVLVFENAAYPGFQNASLPAFRE